MLIVAGHLSVRPEDRDPWVEAHREVLKIALSFPGCIDLFVAADPADEGRVNMFELWESEEALAAWRANAEPVGAGNSVRPLSLRAVRGVGDLWRRVQTIPSARRLISCFTRAREYQMTPSLARHSSTTHAANVELALTTPSR
jgi:quinol monooxygenase YgiN